MKKNFSNKYSPGRLYVFRPKEEIGSELVKELANIIQIGVGGHTLEKFSEELQKHFEEVSLEKAA